ncbi:hypothetical protein SESBI_14680 [Sesbania bispinosa]|nr:hypothetical protein SESBI_14680 [Sesbania bispinosa]
MLTASLQESKRNTIDKQRLAESCHGDCEKHHRRQLDEREAWTEPSVYCLVHPISGGFHFTQVEETELGPLIELFWTKAVKKV